MRKMWSIIAGSAAVLVVAAAAGLAALPAFYEGRILPGVSVAGIRLGGVPIAEAQRRFGEHTAQPLTLRFVQDADLFGLAGAGSMDVAQADPRELGASVDANATVEAAYHLGRSTGLQGISERIALLRGVSVPLSWKVDSAALTAYLHTAFPQGFTEPRPAAWELTETGAFVYQPSQPGTAVALETVADSIADRLRRRSNEPVRLAVATVAAPEPDVAGAETARVLSAPLTLVTEDGKSLTVEPSVRTGWVTQPKTAKDVPTLNKEAMTAYVKSSVASALSTPARDAQFSVDGDRGTFTAPQAGTEVLVPQTADGIIQGLTAGAEKIKVMTKAVRPSVVQTPLMEEYGIRTLVARGESDFTGSPRNRQHNIRVGSEKYHGLLVPPGGEFSFNVNLGPVDKEHGFLPELVILANVTTPQYGGGLCQVSTTMFRTAIHGGFPIMARKNHAYAVSYYGTPGFDATIYPPNPDLKFVNDTAGHLLIQMKLEGTKLAFEFWGTSDGRQVEVFGPYPYDRQKNGAVKARLVRKMTKGGEVQRQEWFSNYKSPALFPKVLAANAESETWDARVRRIEEKDRKAREEFERQKAELERRQKASRSAEAARGTSGSKQEGTTGTPKPAPAPSTEQ